MDTVIEIEDVLILAAMASVLPWQQTLICLILLIKVLLRQNFVRRFPLAYKAYLSASHCQCQLPSLMLQ